MSTPPSETLAALDRAIELVADFDYLWTGDAALLQALRDDLSKQIGECICPKRGLRHGASHAVSTEF